MSTEENSGPRHTPRHGTRRPTPRADSPRASHARHGSAPQQGSHAAHRHAGPAQHAPSSERTQRHAQQHAQQGTPQQRGARHSAEPTPEQRAASQRSAAERAAASQAAAQRREAARSAYANASAPRETARRAASLRSQAPRSAMSPKDRRHNPVASFFGGLFIFLVALTLIFGGKTVVLDQMPLTPENVLFSFTSTMGAIPAGVAQLLPGPHARLAQTAPEGMAKSATVLAAKVSDAGKKLTAQKQTESNRSTDFAVRAGDPPSNTQPSDTKTLYLTFDDGPSDKTQAVLDILDRYGAKATFFVTGIDQSHANMIKVAHDKGHTIGLHTYSHDYASVYSSVGAYFSDLDAIGQVVKEQIGYVPCFIRFPGGASNTISANYSAGIMSQLTSDVQARGYQYYDWDASCGDGSVHDADETAAIATEDSPAVGMQNVIMLLHDSATKQSTVDALPRIIEYWKAQGYELKAIDRDTRISHQGVNN